MLKVLILSNNSDIYNQAGKIRPAAIVSLTDRISDIHRLKNSYDYIIVDLDTTCQSVDLLSIFRSSHNAILFTSNIKNVCMSLTENYPIFSSQDGIFRFFSMISKSYLNKAAS